MIERLLICSTLVGQSSKVRSPNDNPVAWIVESAKTVWDKQSSDAKSINNKDVDFIVYGVGEHLAQAYPLGPFAGKLFNFE